jgi:hypothetical protein
MMMPLTSYVESRQTSLSTINRHIKRLNLDLPLNPKDKRQKLVSSENQSRLDAAIGYQPSIDVIEPIEVIPYERSENVSMIIAEGEILKAQHLVPYQRADQNPLLLALQRQAEEMQRSNNARYQQIKQDNQAQQESQQAIAAAKRLRLMEAAHQEAFETHQLRKQLIAQATTELELLDMGLSISSNQPPAPPLQTDPQSSSPAPSPEWL